MRISVPVLHMLMRRKKITKERNLLVTCHLVLTKFKISRSGVGHPSAEKKSPSAYMIPRPTMRTECVGTATMQRGAPRCQTNVSILTDPCMRTVSARTATLVTITKLRDFLKKLKNKDLRPKRHCSPARSKGRGNQKRKQTKLFLLSRPQSDYLLRNSITWAEQFSTDLPLT